MDKQSERLYLEIGRLTVTFSELEFYLNALVWELMNVQRRVGSLITRRSSFSQLVDLLEGLLELPWHETLHPDPAGLRRRLQEANESRNDVMHSIWHVPVNDPVGPARARIRDIQQLREDVWVDVSPDDVETVTRKVAAVLSEIKDIGIKKFRMRHGEEIS